MQEASEKNTVEGDELILLGDQGSGCWDDEDCTTYPTEVGSGDDLITPKVTHILRSTPHPRQASVTTPRYHANAGGGGKARGNNQCDDDEDCVEGSGSDDDNTPRPSYSISTSPPWPGNRPLPMPPTTSPTYERPPFIYPTPPPAPPTPRTEEVDRSILFTSKPIPPAVPVYPNGRNYPAPRPSPPPRPTGRPVIVDVPKPVIPTHVKEQREKEKPKPTTTYTTYNKSSADRTALIIGLIAVILIVIVIIAPIIVFIKVRYRTGSACKTVDERNKNYQFAPVTATPPTTLLTTAQNGASSVSHLNGASSMTAVNEYNKQASKLPKKKDLKEWYV